MQSVELERPWSHPASRAAGSGSDTALLIPMPGSFHLAWSGTSLLSNLCHSSWVTTLGFQMTALSTSNFETVSRSAIQSARRCYQQSGLQSLSFIRFYLCMFVKKKKSRGRYLRCLNWAHIFKQTARYIHINTYYYTHVSIYMHTHVCI